MSLEKFVEKVSTCENCRLAKERYSVVTGRGTFPAKILFVGEAPGREEDVEGKAFVGNAGEVLNNALEFSGFRQIVNPNIQIVNEGEKNDNRPAAIDNIPYFIDNMVRCRPPANRKPEADEVDACWPWLSELIGNMDPKVIIPMGDTALQGLARKLGFKKTIGTKKITELVGRVLVLNDGKVIVPAFHPAYIARRRDMQGDYLRFFSFLKQSYPSWLKVKGKMSA